MTYSDESYNLHIKLDTKNCELSEGEIQHLEQALDPLRGPVEKFPVSNLYVTVEFFPRSHDYRLKVVLALPGRQLATGDVDQYPLPGLERCVRKLIHKVIAYEGQLGDQEDVSKHIKGTRHEITPTDQADLAAAQKAVEAGDYGSFRRSMYVYEEPLRKRIGRWIQRYPVLDAQLGDRFDLSDVVEEVFLNAFERFEHHSRDVPYGEWLEHLIDPSLRLLSRDPVEELENISFARSLTEKS